MKKIFLFAFLISTTLAFAQTDDKKPAITNQGEIVYTTTVNMHKQIRGPRADEIKKMVPEFQKLKHVLYFNESEALSHKLKEEQDVNEADLDQGRGGFRMRMMGGGADDRYYTNLDEETITNQVNFMGKDFLVQDDWETKQWKLTGQSKEILGYTCYQANLVIKVDTTAQKEENREGRGRGPRRRGPKSVEAWFTTEIPVSAGPNNYHQLPGMVLEVNIDEGNQVIKAESVDLKELEEGTITEPTKGKKVTQEEFRKIQREKFEEMRKEYGGRGKPGGGGGRGHRVIIQN